MRSLSRRRALFHRCRVPPRRRPHRRPGGLGGHHSTTVSQTGSSTLRAGGRQAVVRRSRSTGPRPRRDARPLRPPAQSRPVHDRGRRHRHQRRHRQRRAHGADGYWLADLGGNVKAYGSAPDLGDLIRTYGLWNWVSGIAPPRPGTATAGYGRRQGVPFGDAPQGVIDYGPPDNDWSPGSSPPPGSPATARHRRAGRPATARSTTPPPPPPRVRRGPVMAWWRPSGTATGSTTGSGTWPASETPRCTATCRHPWRPLGHRHGGHPTGSGYWLMTTTARLRLRSAGVFGSMAGHDAGSIYSVILPSGTASAYDLFTVQGAVHTSATPSTTAPCTTSRPRRARRPRHTSLAPARRP